MADILANDLVRFRKDVSSFHTQLGTLKQLYSQMWNEMTYISTRWEGPAKETYVQGLSSGLNELKELLEELVSVGEDLNQAETSYYSCERDVEGIIASLTVE